MVPGRVQKTVGAFHDRNSQTRMTNDEIRRNDQTRMDETGDCATQSIWTFELRISFVIRHSSFNDICKSGSWSQCMRKKRKGAFHESPIPFGIPLRMKEYNVRRVGLGVRNLFRSGGGRTEVRAPDGLRRCRSEATVPYRRLGVSKSTVDSHFRGNRTVPFGDAELFCDCLRNQRPVNVIKMTPRCD